MRIGRHIGFMLWGAVALSLSAASFAWACTEDAGIAGTPSDVPPGALMTVEGMAFYDGGRVEIYLDSPDGKRNPLGSASGPNFEIDVRVPADLVEGTHYLVAYGYNEEGQQEGKAEAVVTVTYPPQEKEPEPTQRPDTNNKTGDPGSDQAPPREGGGAASRNNQVPAASTIADSATSPTEVRSAPAAASAPERNRKSEPRTGAGEISRAADAAAWGDMWSGFAAEDDRVLVPSLTYPVPANEPLNLWVPLSLGALGLVILMAGFTVATIRRRQPVEVDSSDQ